MTKRLLLLRHAQSDSGYTGKDKERPLASEGVSEAATLGYYIRDNGWSPDCVLCSDALRTRETLRHVSKSLYYNLVTDKTVFLPALYSGGVEDYLLHIQQCNDAARTIMLVGHQPNLPIFARMLASPDSFRKPVAQIFDRYFPATLSIFSCAINRWEDLRYGENSLVDVVNPNNLICHLF